MANVKEWFKNKTKKAKEYTAKKTERLGEWAKEHPEEAATIGVAALGAFVGIYRGCRRDAKKRQEERLKERYVYDRSLGSYWCLKRKPTKSEKLEIERRRARGEKYGSIFSDMRLL